MAKAQQPDVTAGGKPLLGRLLRGYHAMDPELAMSKFKLPGQSAEIIKTLGLMGRMIVCPMLVHDPSLNSRGKVAKYLRALEERKAEGRELTVKIRTGDEVEQFDHCLFVGAPINPQIGILEDVARSLSSSRNASAAWFCELTILFYQAKVL